MVLAWASHFKFICVDHWIVDDDTSTSSHQPQCPTHPRLYQLFKVFSWRNPLLLFYQWMPLFCWLSNHNDTRWLVDFQGEYIIHNNARTTDYYCLGFLMNQYIPQQTRDVHPMLDKYWSYVYDAGPALGQHCVDGWCLLGCYNEFTLQVILPGLWYQRPYTWYTTSFL